MQITVGPLMLQALYVGTRNPAKNFWRVELHLNGIKAIATSGKYLHPAARLACVLFSQHYLPVYARISGKVAAELAFSAQTAILKHLLASPTLTDPANHQPAYRPFLPPPGVSGPFVATGRVNAEDEAHE